MGHELRPDLSGHFICFIPCCLRLLCNLQLGLECPKCLLLHVWCLGSLEFLSLSLSLCFLGNLKRASFPKRQASIWSAYQASAGIMLACVLLAELSVHVGGEYVDVWILGCEVYWNCLQSNNLLQSAPCLLMSHIVPVCKRTHVPKTPKSH